MAVIVNELEVVTEQPTLGEQAAAENADVVQRQVARLVNPEVIGGVWHREIERCARSYAG
jgi:hypothetical protein